MPWLCIETVHDREYISVMFTAKAQPDLGKRTFIELSDEEAMLPLDDLRKAYKDKVVKEVQTETLTTKRAELAHRLGLIIEQSNQEGEVASARSLYKKLMGVDYKGKKS